MYGGSLDFDPLDCFLIGAIALSMSNYTCVRCNYLVCRFRLEHDIPREFVTWLGLFVAVLRNVDLLVQGALCSCLPIIRDIDWTLSIFYFQTQEQLVARNKLYSIT